jgi:hypothetical protein
MPGGQFESAERKSPRAVGPPAPLDGSGAIGSTTARLLRLQRTVGNRATATLLSSRSSARLGAIPPRMAIQRQLVVNGKEVTRPEDLATELGEDFEAMQKGIQKLVDLPGKPVNLTLDQLKDVIKYTKRGAMPTDTAAKLAVLQLVSYGAWTNPGVKAVSAAAYSTGSMKNLKNLGTLLKYHQKNTENLKVAGVTFELMSARMDLLNMGGAAVINNVIHIHTSAMTEPWEKFARLVVHEMGHATFQRALVRGEGLSDAANEGSAKPDEKALVEDGKLFYEAWQIIRQKPQYFYLTEMPDYGPKSKGKERQEYLRDKFTEFCAESFMHLGLHKEELQEHIGRIPPEAGNVKQAWQSAMRVLLKYESQMFTPAEDDEPVADDAEKADKQPAPSMQADIRNSHYMVTLQELRSAMPQPGRELEDTNAVEATLKRLRGLWRLLTPAHRAEHRDATLMVLDQFLWQVRRRRPPQAVIGPELDFAELIV